MTARWLDDERALDLLVQDATEGLDDGERRELEALLGDSLEEARAQMHAAAGAVALAGTRREPMPAALRARLTALDLPAQQPPAISSPRPAAPVTDLASRRAPRATRGIAPAWWAAAACLVIAVAGWWPQLTTAPSVAPAAARAALAARSGVVQLAWTRGPDATAANVTGDVVFDPQTQRGYLRFRGLPQNDPRRAQYQLWIVDATRPEPQPIDGGVFDVPVAAADGSGDVLIPFQPRLPVGRAAAFVVTLERPGGVVVSGQERVLAIAKA